MSVEHEARLRWLPAEAGGRVRPPPGPTYSTVARFEHRADVWPDEAWSVVLHISAPTDASGEMIAGIRMLVADAPRDLLDPGSRFDLFEGSRLVAHGEVLGRHRRSAQGSVPPT